MTDKIHKAFVMHRSGAKYRGIPFLFEYWEWLQIWQDSGHLHERGTKAGQWCMARNGDKGAYEANNVKIVRVERNNSDAVLTRHNRNREAKMHNLENL